MKTAVVLGAGGFTVQAFHLGALTALRELTGFDARQADALVGTSAGSLVAAGLAGGLSADDLAAELLGEPLSDEGWGLRTVRLSQPIFAQEPAPTRPSGMRPLDPLVLLHAARRPLGVRPLAVMSSLLPRGRVETEPIARGIRHLHGWDWPERELLICAVRARDARRTVFGRLPSPVTDVGTAVAASCAIPAYFAPVRLEGHMFVDGGVHSPTNADVVLREQTSWSSSRRCRCATASACVPTSASGSPYGGYWARRCGGCGKPGYRSWSYSPVARTWP